MADTENYEFQIVVDNDRISDDVKRLLDWSDVDWGYIDAVDEIIPSPGRKPAA